MDLFFFDLFFSRGQRFAFNHGKLLFFEHFLLNMLVRRERNVRLSYLFAQHFPFLPHFIENIMVLPRPITGQAGKIGGEVHARALFTSQRIVGAVLLTCVFTSQSTRKYLHGGRHEATSKSFLLTSQYIPHSSGLEGTKANRLQGHF